jgi:catechol 2,3-dioxygenase-like lactoylglutathione lyase family enzyme
MLPFRLFWVTISTPNLDRAVQWYQDKFGFQVYLRKDFPEFGTRIAHLDIHDFRIELIEQSSAVPMVMPHGDPPNHTNVHGFSQFALLVDDLNGKVEELKSKGVETVWIKRMDPDLKLSFQFVKDCDGNKIQLIELMQEAKEHLASLTKQGGFRFSYQDQLMGGQ